MVQGSTPVPILSSASPRQLLAFPPHCAFPTAPSSKPCLASEPSGGLSLYFSSPIPQPNWCVKNALKTQQHQTTPITSRSFSEPGVREQLGLFQRLRSSEGLAGAGGPSSKVARSHSWQAKCWPWAGDPVLLHVDLPQGCSSVLITWQPPLPWVADPTERGRSHHVFYDLTLEIICYRLCHVLLATKTNPHTVWEWTTHGRKYQEVGIMGHHLGYHTWGAPA